MDTQTLIKEFLAFKRFAMVGVSRNPKDFSRTLFKEFVTQGYDVIPVNPHAFEIEGKQCFPLVSAINPAVQGALLMTPKIGSDAILHQCAEAGISIVWLYGISGPKDIPAQTLRLCNDLGLNVIAGYCPFMVMPSTSWFHQLHGTVWKILGKYPK